MPRTFFDHTGDVGVSLTAASLPDLFREAALALTDTLLGGVPLDADVVHTVHASAPTLDDLMVEWLGEVLYLFEVRNLLTSAAEVRVDQTPEGWVLDATIRGEAFDAARHPIQVLIKGITYHRLNVHHTAAGWATDIVFDI